MRYIVVDELTAIYLIIGKLYPILLHLFKFANYLRIR